MTISLYNFSASLSLVPSQMIFVPNAGNTLYAQQTANVLSKTSLGKHFLKDKLPVVHQRLLERQPAVRFALDGGGWGSSIGESNKIQLTAPKPKSREVTVETYLGKQVTITPPLTYSEIYDFVHAYISIYNVAASNPMTSWMRPDADKLENDERYYIEPVMYGLPSCDISILKDADHDNIVVQRQAHCLAAYVADNLFSTMCYELATSQDRRPWTGNDQFLSSVERAESPWQQALYILMRVQNERVRSASRHANRRDCSCQTERPESPTEVARKKVFAFVESYLTHAGVSLIVHMWLKQAIKGVRDYQPLHHDEEYPSQGAPLYLDFEMPEQMKKMNDEEKVILAFNALVLNDMRSFIYTLKQIKDEHYFTDLLAVAHKVYPDVSECAEQDVSYWRMRSQLDLEAHFEWDHEDWHYQRFAEFLPYYL